MAVLIVQRLILATLLVAGLQAGAVVNLYASGGGETCLLALLDAAPDADGNARLSCCPVTDATNAPASPTPSDGDADPIAADGEPQCLCLGGACVCILAASLLAPDGRLGVVIANPASSLTAAGDLAWRGRSLSPEPPPPNA